MTAQVWIAILVGLAAAVDDLARRRIANWIPAAALAGGFGWQIGQNGAWTGSLHALGGTAVGFAVFLIFYLMGGMGGGDVKLMAGFGALLGLPGVLWAALWTAAFGGLIAIGAVAWQSAGKALRRMLRRAKNVTNEVSKDDRERQETIPYAPAIVLGVWLALVPKG